VSSVARAHFDGRTGGGGMLVASGAGALPRVFNGAGILVPADVHVACRLGAIGGTTDELALLGVAFAVRAVRLGHTCVDLATVRRTVDADTDDQVSLDSLPWPEPSEWVAAVSGSSLVGDCCPLRVEGGTIYLDRYWRDECQIASDLLERSEQPAPGVDISLLCDGLRRLCGEGVDPLQRIASASAVLRRLTVIAGGPGTGKTTTVARILALVDEQARASVGRMPLVGLAAPTGKAAAKLQEAVREEATSLDVDDRISGHLAGIHGLTLHRLLGRHRNGSSGFAHNRSNPLPHDVVVVDEMSMVSLSLMARLVEAVRADARLVLVGDPQQLASVEAGTVLGDVVGPAGQRLRMRQPARAVLGEVTGTEVDAVDPPLMSEPAHAVDTPIGDGIVVLRRVHRFGEGIARLADAVRLGDTDGVFDSLGVPGSLGVAGSDVTWIDSGHDDAAQPGVSALESVRACAVEAGRRVVEAAAAGFAAEAISALGSFRLLCAHRRGPAGSRTWASLVESWLASSVDGFSPVGLWYVGKPLIVTANDYSLLLNNGDTGVVVSGEDGRLVAAFERGNEIVRVSPSRLESVESVYAMTVHKSQGSQFDAVAIVLPEPDSPILTRELLYTAVTRAKQRVVVVGRADSIRTAVERPIARSSGLRRRLWGS